MAYKKWQVANASKQEANRLAELCDVDPFIALIAASRGYTNPEDLELFLAEEPMLSSPYDLPDMAKAVAAVNKAIEENKKIAVFGDYDCDGITATALLYSFLKDKGANVIYYIPDRLSDGYGMSISAVDRLKEKKVDLIITVDNGIAAAEEIAYAKSLGIHTVVTDHHLPPEILPDALAVVDPHINTSPAEFKDVSGVMVAFKLACAIAGAEPEELLPKYSDLLAIGLVADIMPLIDENRSVVRDGIASINNTKKMGMLALLNSAGIGKGSLTAGKISFGIAPRINAAGRMGNAEPALELLLTNDFSKANEIAAFIEQQNCARQAEEQDIFAAAIKQIEENGYEYDRVIVLGGHNWHHGVVGIVAAKITEKYGKPTILLSISGDVASGSGRSISGFPLHDALNSAQDLLTKFGGHALAAGLTLNAEKIDELRKRLNEYAKECGPIVPILKLDCKLNPAGITLDLAEALSVLEPFGMGNPAPVFGVYNLEILRITPISNKKHTKLLLGRAGHTIQALAFGVPADAFPFAMGDNIDIAVSLDINEYLGNRNVSVIVKNFRKSGVDEEAFFADLERYHEFRRGESGLFQMPSREEIGVVYRFLHGKTTEETVKQKFIDSLGYFKTKVAIDVLTELELIEAEESNSVRYLKTVSGKKANLADSRILKGEGR